MYLGDRVRSKVTGFTGIATAHVVYLFHCERVLVQPPVDKDGKDQDGIWVDLDELDVVEFNVLGLPDLERVMVRDELPGSTEHPRPVAATGGGPDPSDRKHGP